MSTTTIFADTDDNEIIITQTGDTLKLYIDQEGFGNKIGGNDSSSSGTAMLITGATLEFDLDFTGNSNILFGPVTADNSTYKLDFALGLLRQTLCLIIGARVPNARYAGAWPSPCSFFEYTSQRSIEVNKKKYMYIDE